MHFELPSFTTQVPRHCQRYAFSEEYKAVDSKVEK